ncbi:hypothetical protein LCGC14_2966280, partial [marine sediment metagenome]
MMGALATVSTGLLYLGLLLAGAWGAALIDRAARHALGGHVSGGMGPLAPLRSAAAMLIRQDVTTEAPDRLNRVMAPMIYLTLAGVALAVVPLTGRGALIDSEVGIVIWGSCEALTVIAVFLHGWAPNAPLPLIGAYRYATIALPVMLPSMFVLIAAALPAQSLSVTSIVAAQADMWNVLRQPLGLPLFMLVGLTLTMRGPFDYADGADLAQGTSSEESGPARALWQFARAGMLVAWSAMATAMFLGGPAGPVLPGLLWVVLKSVLV